MKRIDLVQQNIDEVIKQIFSIAIDILGGPRKLVEYKRLTWLASLMEAILSFTFTVKKTNQQTRLLNFWELALKQQKQFCRASLNMQRASLKVVTALKKLILQVVLQNLHTRHGRKAKVENKKRLYAETA